MSVAEQLRKLLDDYEHYHPGNGPVHVDRGLLRSAVVMLEAVERG